MRDATQAGARIPEDIFDLHTRNVQEKHDGEVVYKGIEAEMAIRAYLDKDDGEELENRLRERVEAMGASTPKRKKLIAVSGSSEKRLAQWRIRPKLKEELKIYAKETGNTYSDVFALAIREFWTNSRLDRIEQLYDRVEAAIEPWEEQLDGDGVNVSVVDRRTAEIAMEIPDVFKRSELEAAIAEVTSDSDYNREKYAPLVKEHKGVELHPKSSELFIPHEEAEEIREKHDIDESGSSLFKQSFDDLTADDSVLRVRARGVLKAKASNGKAVMKHEDISREFDREPGQTTIYNLMGRAADAAGFEYGEWNDTKQLRITVRQVDDNDVFEAVRSHTGNNDTSQKQSTRSELDKLDQAEVVR